MAIDKPRLTCAEVAAVAGCTERTVFKWLQKGKLKAIRIGGLVFVERPELERFIAERTRVVPAR